MTSLQTITIVLWWMAFAKEISIVLTPQGGKTMTDLISRQAALDILCDFAGCIVDTPGGDYHRAYKEYRHKMEILPSANEESFEWCTDCKEYDQEQHCCHRWTKNIMETIEEIKESYHIINCRDCANFILSQNGVDGKCSEWGASTCSYEWCSKGVKEI